IEARWDSEKALRAAALRLCSRDYLAVLLLKISRQSGVRVGLLALGFHAILVMIPAIAIPALYPIQPPPFLAITPSDTRALPNEFLIDLIVPVLIWTFYAWQPRGVIDVFSGLSRNGVLVPDGADLAAF